MTTPGPLSAEPTTVIVGNQTYPICPPVGGSVMLYNNDLVNTVYVGYRSTLAPTNSLPIAPLTPVVVDGSRQVWAYCPTGTALVTVTPGGTYQAPSAAQIAAQIALSGISFANPTLLVDQESIPAGSGAWGAANINFGPATSYEINLAGVTNGEPFVTDLVIEHLDSTGEVVDIESFTVSNYPNTSNFEVVVRGLLRGTQLLISGDAATSAYINTILGTAITAGAFTVSVYGLSYPLPSSAPKVTRTPVTGNLASFFNVSIPAGTAETVAVPADYSGSVYETLFINSGAGPVFLALQSYSVANGTNPLFTNFFQPITSGGQHQEIGFDNFWHVLQAHNTGAAATAVSGILAAKNVV